MKPPRSMSWQVIEGDCVGQMRELDEASIDAIVCDPPYGLEFMGKEWDRLGAAKLDDPAEVGGFQDGAGGNPYSRSRIRFGQRASQEWHQTWATEALRVLKPGGHLLAFGGTRTYHRLACAIEDAGFEIRDSLIWIYGSGFPKSLDVSKAIDKAAGVEREVVGTYAAQWEGWGTALKPSHEPVVVARKPLGGTVASNVLAFGTGALNIDGTRVGNDRANGYDAGEWEHGLNLCDSCASDAASPPRPATPATRASSAPSPAEPTSSARAAAPLSGTSRRATGCSDGQSRVEQSADPSGGTSSSTAASGSSTTGEPSQTDTSSTTSTATSPTTESRTCSSCGAAFIRATTRPSGASSGRWPSNLALSHLDECERVGERRVKSGVAVKLNREPGTLTSWMGTRPSQTGDDVTYADSDGLETVQVWACAPGCPVAELDRQSGESSTPSHVKRGARRQQDGWGMGEMEDVPCYGDTGGASRFFPTFGFSIIEPCPLHGESSEPRVDDSASTSSGKKAGNSAASSPTDGSGSKPTGRSRAAMTSTTKTTTRSTTTSPTSNSSSEGGTSGTTENSEPPRSNATESASAPDAESGNPSTPTPPELTPPDSPTAATAAVCTCGSGEPRTASITTPITAPIESGSQPRFQYQAKASRAERNAGLDGFEERENVGVRYTTMAGDGRENPEVKPVARANVHPTVKPIDLMRWLCRLVTPPEGTILDPFTGSGTTGCAAVLEDFDFIGIEREPEYVAIAKARIDHWNRQPKQLDLLVA